MFQDFFALQKQISNHIDKMREVQNNSGVLNSGTNTYSTLLNVGVNMPETHPNLEMDLNISSGHAVLTEVMQNYLFSSSGFSNDT